jgi:hypothetical protein
MYKSTPIPIINATGQALQTYVTMQSSANGSSNYQLVDPKLAYDPVTGILSVNKIEYKNNGTVESHLPRSVQTYIDIPSTQSFVAQNRAEVVGLSATITPRSTNSKIFITVRWMGEYGNDNYVYNSMWGLSRNGSTIGPAVNPGSRLWGIQTSTLSYWVVDNNSTPEPVNFSYLDSPNTTLPCTYSVTFLSYVNITLYTNRTVGDLDQTAGYERGTCCITLTELA